MVSRIAHVRTNLSTIEATPKIWSCERFSHTIGLMDYTQHPRLEFRRKFFKFFGAEIAVSDATTQQHVGFIKMKAFKLKEVICMYTDASMQSEIMTIKARSIIDFGATYDVFDPVSGGLICSLRRKGLRSTFVRDKWEVLDGQGSVTGHVIETSGWLAIVRRYVGAINDLLTIAFSLVPETYRISTFAGGAEVETATIIHRKNPFVVKMSLDATSRPESEDPRVNIAVTAVLAVIDASKG